MALSRVERSASDGLPFEVNAMKFQYLEQQAKRGDTGVCLRIGSIALPLCRLGTFVICLATLAPSPARAVDGCTVLFCLAAPSWRSIEQCVPPVRQLLRDLALGKPFPTCTMSGVGNSATHAWSAAPDFCPPQYTRVYDGPNGPVYTCDYTGAISVSVDGMPFARTWWSMNGDSVTEFSPTAKVQLGSWEKRFDDEFAAWLAQRPETSQTLH